MWYYLLKSEFKDPAELTQVVKNLEALRKQLDETGGTRHGANLGARPRSSRLCGATITSR
jgi:hypothetical protein